MANVVPVLPVEGVKVPTSGNLSFGYQRTPNHKHQGVDLHAPRGSLVRACLPGVVQQAAARLTPGFSGYGRIVVIHSEREQTPDGLSEVWCLYAHLDQVLVRSGQRVAAGDAIATVGDSCFNRDEPEKRCNRTHLHFEVSPRAYPQDSEAPRLDPVPLIAGPWAQTRRSVGVALAIAVATLAGWLWERLR